MTSVKVGGGGAFRESLSREFRLEKAAADPAVVVDVLATAPRNDQDELLVDAVPLLLPPPRATTTASTWEIGRRTTTALALLNIFFVMALLANVALSSSASAAFWDRRWVVAGRATAVAAAAAAEMSLFVEGFIPMNYNQPQTGRSVVGGDGAPRLRQPRVMLLGSIQLVVVVVVVVVCAVR